MIIVTITTCLSSCPLPIDALCSRTRDLTCIKSTKHLILYRNCRSNSTYAIDWTDQSSKYDFNHLKHVISNPFICNIIILFRYSLIIIGDGCFIAERSQENNYTFITIPTKDKIVSECLLVIKRAIKAAILNTVIRERTTNYRSPQNINNKMEIYSKEKISAAVLFPR